MTADTILTSLGLGITSGLVAYHVYRSIKPHRIVVQTPPTETKLNVEQNAMVEQTLHWRPIETCPQNVTLWLLGQGNVSFKGQYRKGDSFVKGWFPMPNIPEDMK